MRHTYFNTVSFFNCHVFANVVGITLSESFSKQFGQSMPIFMAFLNQAQ